MLHVVKVIFFMCVYLPLAGSAIKRKKVRPVISLNFHTCYVKSFGVLHEVTVSYNRPEITVLKLVENLTRSIRYGTTLRSDALRAYKDRTFLCSFNNREIPHINDG